MKGLMLLVGCALLFVLVSCASDTADNLPSPAEDQAEGDDTEEAVPEPDRYEISNVRIQREEPLVGNVPTYFVVFDAAWLGGGAPPMATCSYTVFAKDGAKIERGVTRLAVDEGKDLEATVLKEGIVPASARFGKCRPT